MEKITDERFIKMTASYEKEQKNLTASVENWKLELKNAQQQDRNRDESRYGGNPAQPQAGNHHIKTAAAQSTNVKLCRCLYNTSLWVPS